jgi:hypothetical protein
MNSPPLDTKLVTAYSVLISLLAGLCFTTCTEKKPITIMTKIIEVNSLSDLNKLDLNFCDSFSLEITGLYPILDSLPSVTNDSTLAKQLLINRGFTLVDGGWGNWTKGPRCLYLKFNKHDVLVRHSRSIITTRRWKTDFMICEFLSG